MKLRGARTGQEVHLIALHVELGDRPQRRLGDIEQAVAQALYLTEHITDRHRKMALLDLDQNRRAATPEHLSAATQHRHLMPFDIDLHKIYVDTPEHVV